ncbi:MAG: hypothetical protein H6553_04390 [Chitinophagales bacterium]|nr:hypothetical protein [Chitinophagales bacterium]
MKLKQFISFSLILIFVLITFDVQAQCPMCKKAAESSNLARSFNTGILYLLLAPVVILGTVFTIWYKKRKDFLAIED